MARLQVGGIESGGALQTISAGRVQMNAVSGETARADQLVQSLKGFAPALQMLKETNDAVDNDEADAFFRSKTLGEIGQLVKDGKLPPTASPVFQARVQNLYGSNYLAQVERDLDQKMVEGAFAPDEEGDTAAKVDKYLVDTRNGFLEGASAYTRAGFDERFLVLKNKAMGIVAEQQVREGEEKAVGLETENAVNILQGYKTKDAFGVEMLQPEGVSKALEAYKKGSTYTNMTPQRRKAVLGNLVQELVTSGDADGLRAFLDAPLDNGLTVGTVVYGADRGKQRQALGMAREADFKKNATVAEQYHDRLSIQAEEGSLDRKAFDEARTRFDPYKDWGSILRTNEAAIRRRDLDTEQLDAKLAFEQAQARHKSSAMGRVRESLISGNVVNEPDQQVSTPSGGTKTLAEEDGIREALDVLTADKAPEVRADNYARWGLVDFKSKQELNQALGALSAAAQPGAVLPETVKEGISLFRRFNTTNPAYTQELLGKQGYADMRLADSLINRFSQTPEQAANAILRIKSSNFAGNDPEGKKVAAAVDSAMASIKDPGKLSTAWTKLFGSAAEKELAGWGAVERNIKNVEGEMTVMAKAMLQMGLAETGEQAVEMAMADGIKTGNVVRANNALYWATDLPSKLPREVTPSDAMKFYRRGLVTQYAKQGRSYSEDDIDLRPNGNGTFALYLRDSDTGRVSLVRTVIPVKAIEKYISDRQLRLDRERVDSITARRNDPTGLRNTSKVKTSLALGGAQITPAQQARMDAAAAAANKKQATMGDTGGRKTSMAVGGATLPQ